MRLRLLNIPANFLISNYVGVRERIDFVKRMSFRTRIPFCLAPLLLLLCAAPPLLAADSKKPDSKKPVSKETSEEQLMNCAFYRSKRDGVPVYEKADRSSPVLHKLALGEYVCHIGSRGTFAILDWRKQSLINKEEKSTQEKSKEPLPELAYVRLVDLWKDDRPRPSGAEDKDFFSQAKEHINSIGDSLAPDDIFGPLRPIIDIIHPPTKCRAGKICEKVEQEQRKLEERAKEKEKEKGS